MFYHNNTGTGTHDSGILPLTYGAGSLPAHQRARRSPRCTWSTQAAVQGTSSTRQQEPHSSEASTNLTKSSLALQRDHSHLSRQSPAQLGQRSAQPTRATKEWPHQSRRAQAAHTGQHQSLQIWGPEGCVGLGPPGGLLPKTTSPRPGSEMSYLTQGIRDLRSQRNMSQQRNNI